MAAAVAEKVDRIFRLVPDAALIATILLHAWAAPFTKVEESFNLHAAHDILTYGIAPRALQRYDHKIFPGAVPRSFVGSLALALAVRPVLLFAQILGVVQRKVDIQLIVRGVLGACNGVGLVVVRRAVSRRFGTRAGVFFLLFSATQFHLPFWASRTLPNMFALLPANLALALLIDNPGSAPEYADSACTAISYLVAAAIVLRAELVLLVAPVALQLLIRREVSFARLLKTGLVTATLSIVATVLLDSYFWSSQQPLWPELYSVYFNIYQGKSAEWGVSPAWEYVVKHIPKMMLVTFPLALVAPILDRRLVPLYLPVAIFVGALSKLGHKEWRFVVYVMPWLNVGASAAASIIWKERPNAKSKAEKPNTKIWERPRSLGVTVLLRLGLAGLLCANALLTAGLAHISARNYPGGAAMRALHAAAEPVPAHAHIHICNLAAQSGASLFTFEHRAWTYNKTEHLGPRDITEGPFTHAIVEYWSEEAYGVGTWEVKREIEGFAGLRWERVRGVPVPLVRMRTQLWILERR